MSILQCRSDIPCTVRWRFVILEGRLLCLFALRFADLAFCGHDWWKTESGDAHGVRGKRAACKHFSLRLMTVRQTFIFTEHINSHIQINFADIMSIGRG